MAKSISDAIFYGGIPIVGALGALLLSKMSVRYGHRLIQFGPTNPYLVALIGVVQNVAGFALAIRFGNHGDPLKEIIAKIVGAYIVTGVALFGLTALAAKVNIIAHRLTVAGTGMLIAVGVIGTLMTAFTAIAIHNLRKEKE